MRLLRRLGRFDTRLSSFWSRGGSIDCKRGDAGFRSPLYHLHGSKGLTVPELLIAITLIAILAAVSIPVITGILQGYRLRVAAWQLAGDLRLARQKAVSTQVRYRACFTGCSNPVPNPGYVVEREAGAVWQLDFSVDFSTQPVGFNLTVSSPVNPTFNAKGTTGPGTVCLTNPAGTYLVVTAQSGRVQVSKGSCP